MTRTAPVCNATYTSNTSYTVTMTDWTWHRPEGRGRKFRRAARGLARRMRLPFVRRTLWEREHPEAFVGHPPTYGPPWNSTNALADFSFACVCHKRERYSRKGRKRA